MAYLANQNQIFQTTTQYLHKIHSELPAARIRNFDILTAVDALTTGTYQRMPTKYQVYFLMASEGRYVRMISNRGYDRIWSLQRR